jgi:hypothetical protein
LAHFECAAQVFGEMGAVRDLGIVKALAEEYRLKV